jgi:calcineurin-like phosphoesterase family protein/predicted kinase
MEKLKLMVLIGISGSGKSTWAKQYCKEHADWVRINKDDIRTKMKIEMGLRDDARVNEKEVLRREESKMLKTFQEGKSVILDNTHLNPMHLNERLPKFLKDNDLDDKVEIVVDKSFLEVPLETCIERDSKRTGTEMVGERVILGQWNQAQHWMDKPTPRVPEILTLNETTDPFIIGDTHFFHRNIISFEPIRLRLGDDEETMSWEIVKRWNSVVTPEDTIIHLGDVAFQIGRKFEEICRMVQSLNGHKILIKGNHDHAEDSKYLEMGFEKVVIGPVLFKDIVLSHEPVLNTQALNIHGHLHRYPNPDKPSHRPLESPEPTSKMHFNASIEMLLDFKPIRLSRILKEF